MPKKPTPWFQLFAADLLTDEKIEALTHEELGVLLRLWAKMWINGVERGALYLEKGVPIPVDQIARFLGITIEQFKKLEGKFVDTLKILKRGVEGELFSERLRNFKTKWELYGREKDSKKNRKRKIPERNRTTELELESELEKIKEKTCAVPAVNVDNSIQNEPLETKPSPEDKVESFLGGKTGFGKGGNDRSRQFRDEVKQVCLAFVNRCREWGDDITDENAAVNEIFGMVLNLMAYGVPRIPKGILNFRGSPTDLKVALELVAALSKKRPRDPKAELIDAFKRPPVYRRF